MDKSQRSSLAVISFPFIFIALVTWYNWPGATPSPAKPPFTTSIGKVTISVPKSDVYQGVWFDKYWGIRLDICSPEFGVDSQESCNPFGGEGGVEVFLKAPFASTKYDLIKQRPAVDAPPKIALRPVILEPSQRSIGPSSLDENYELSRIQGPFSKQLATTNAGWPITACGTHPSRRTVSCGVGFRIDDMFVEAHWTLRGAKLPNQQEVWTTASKIDKNIRGLIAQKPNG